MSAKAFPCPPVPFRSLARSPSLIYFLFFFFFLPGLLSWDASSCHVDLEKELKVVTEAAPPGEELRAGDN